MHTHPFSRRLAHHYILQWDIQHWTLLLLISSSRFLLTYWRSVKRISRKTLPFSYYGLRSECFAWTALHFMRVPVLSRVLKPRFKLWVWCGCQWNLRSSDGVCNAFIWVMDENLRNFFCFENFSSVQRCDACEVHFSERVNGCQGECKNC